MRERPGGVPGELVRPAGLLRAERARTARVQHQRADRLALVDQRHRVAGTDADRRRLPAEAGPVARGRHVADVHRARVPQPVQGRAVPRLVLHPVRLGRQRVAARRGGRRAAPLPKRHPAGHLIACAHGPHREHGQLVQELLDTIGLQQCVLQAREV
jgi:hypothetical protein